MISIVKTNLQNCWFSNFVTRAPEQDIFNMGKGKDVIFVLFA